MKATLLLAALCATLASCTTTPAPGRAGGGAMVLDNHAGQGVTGRRVVLHPDGSFEQTLYTDVREAGQGRELKGTYRFSEDRKQLTLVSPSGGEQILYRTPHGGKVYWVKSGERVRIEEDSTEGKKLRQNSLRTER